MVVNKLTIHMVKLLLVLIVPLILVAGFFLLYNASALPRRTVYGENSVWDMRQFDFGTYNAYLSGYAAVIPEVLLGPEGFAARVGEAAAEDARDFSHATSHQVLLVSDDGWYTLSRISARYAHRVYVNGRLVVSVGLPGTAADENASGYGRILITAQAQNGVIEIVQQVSNFMGIRGSSHQSWTVGVGDALINEARVNDAQRAMIMGMFLMMSLLLLLLYFTFVKHKGMLFSSLFAMVWYARLGAAGERLLAPFGDWLNGVILFRIEYVTIPLAIISVVAIICELFPTVLPKAVSRGIYVMFALLALFFLLADTRMVAQVNSMLYAVYGIALALPLAGFVLKVRRYNIEQWLFLVGMTIAGLFTGFYLIDFALPAVLPTLAFDPAGVPMLLFLIFMAIAVFYATMNETNATKMLKEVAEASNAAKSKFLTTISHELRTPLNAIIGISNIELERNTQPNDINESLEIIQNSGTTLLGLVNDILDLSKVETGKLDLLPAEYDVTSLIHDTSRLNVMRIDEKPIHFNIKVDENLPKTLIGDELRIKQVLNNVLSNAIKYTDEGSVAFEARVEKSGTADDVLMLVFTIRDTGQGMTPEQLAALYDAYSMFNQEANRTIEGTGLGMSITKSLVDMMDGKIEARSKIGEGSEFNIYLQQRKKDETIIGKEAAENLQNLKVSDKTHHMQIKREFMPYGTVLIVDDVDANIFVAKGLMKPYGLTIESAASGQEAIKKILMKIKAGQHYDIVFMDHMMPGMDGVEATKIIRKNGYSHPIIALTANAIAGQKEMFLANGFNDFVSKPIDVKILNGQLNQYIRDIQSPETLAAAQQQKEGKAAPKAPLRTDPLTALKKIDALDTHTAIEALGGMADFYVNTVSVTLKSIPAAIKKIRALPATDIAAFTIEVHGLKSMLHNIGAITLAHTANALEQAAAKNEADYCQAHYPSFEASVNTLTQALHAAFFEVAGSGGVSPKRTLLAQARQALENHNYKEAQINLQKLGEIIDEN